MYLFIYNISENHTFSTYYFYKFVNIIKFSLIPEKFYLF